MATIKQTLDSYFFSFIDNNGLESLKEKMCETITKCEYALDDVIEKIVDNETMNACKELENDIDYYQEQINDLEEDYRKLKESKDDFFEAKTLQDEFKIQWIKDNWDKIPSI
jgi:predicted nuclease with TOPRIM domain